MTVSRAIDDDAVPGQPTHLWTLDSTLAMQQQDPAQAKLLLSRCVDGSLGPRFGRRSDPGVLRAGPDRWPLWTDAIASQPGDHREQGGRRTTGQLAPSASDLPLVTYVTVVKNAASTLPTTIASVRRQRYPNVEHVIVDGASTDGTLDVLRRHADSVDYFVSQPDGGMYDALNTAVPLARGEIICVLNADDWLEPSAAETAVAWLGSRRSPTLLLSAAHVLRSDAGHDRVIGDWYPTLVHPGCYFLCALDCHNAIYATRSAYELSGPYDESYDIAGDFKWIMRAFESEVDCVYTNQVTVNYRLGGSSSSNSERHSHECVRVIRERFPSLADEEAGALHHAFFLMPSFPTVPGKQADAAAFVRTLCIQHADDAELMEAVAWATLARMDHAAGDHAARTPFGVRPAITVLRDAVKRALLNHPRLYRGARRLGSLIRRK